MSSHPSHRPSFAALALAACALVVPSASADKATEVVEFEKGGAELTEGELTSLRALVAGLGNPVGRRVVYVAGWADREVREDGRPLGNDAVKLADARVREVREALEALSVRGDVVSVNLAKEPGTLQRVFGTKNAKVGQRALRGKNAGDPALDDAGRVIRDGGGAGKVVVYVQ